jgi:plastocyanin
MRNYRLALLAAALVVGCDKKDPVAPLANAVSVVDFAFNPTANAVPAGTTVTWTFTTTTVHDVTFSTPGMTGSGDKTGGTFAKAFPTAGTFTYQCSKHPVLMNGTITVQ